MLPPPINSHYTTSTSPKRGLGIRLDHQDAQMLSHPTQAASALTLASDTPEFTVVKTSSLIPLEIEDNYFAQQTQSGLQQVPVCGQLTKLNLHSDSSTSFNANLNQPTTLVKDTSFNMIQPGHALTTSSSAASSSCSDSQNFVLLTNPLNSQAQDDKLQHKLYKPEVQQCALRMIEDQSQAKTGMLLQVQKSSPIKLVKQQEKENSPIQAMHLSDDDDNPDEEDKGYEKLVSQSQKRTGKISKENFTMLKVIGTGSYGKVLLVKKKDTGRLYAMKVLKKKHIRQKKQVKNTWTERKILEKINHPFIVKLNFAFHTQKKLFFVLDYCPGGELFFYISQIGRFKEQSAKFYAANILLALECLHQNGIVYRDLKPENILIDSDGFAKLTDFGLSKENIFIPTGAGQGLASSLCGTCEYLAPEVLSATKDRTYGQSCDWWSFGCVLYEMLTAIPPFYSKKRDELFSLIRTQDPKFYSYHSPEAKDLITRLLIKDPAQRLTNVLDIKAHPFFSEIDWRVMLRKEMRTPYKPMLDQSDDTKHFDADICKIPVESPNMIPTSQGGISLSEQGEEDDFDGFTFEAQTMLSGGSGTPQSLKRKASYQYSPQCGKPCSMSKSSPVGIQNPTNPDHVYVSPYEEPRIDEFY